VLNGCTKCQRTRKTGYVWDYLTNIVTPSFSPSVSNATLLASGLHIFPSENRFRVVLYCKTTPSPLLPSVLDPKPILESLKQTLPDDSEVTKRCSMDGLGLYRTPVTSEASWIVCVAFIVVLVRVSISL